MLLFIMGSLTYTVSVPVISVRENYRMTLVNVIRASKTKSKTSVGEKLCRLSLGLMIQNCIKKIIIHNYPFIKN